MNIRDFFDNKMNIVLLVLVLCFFLFGGLLIVRVRQIRSIDVDAKTPVVVDTNMLYLLDEPLKTPPVQFSRKQRKQWSINEIEWWIGDEPFTKEEVELLKLKNRELIQKLLDNTP